MQAASVSHEDIEPDLRRVTLAGRLDMLGMEEIALRFTALTAAKPRRVIVDLTGVTFLASIGIRSLISSARALDSRGGRMVLVVGDNELVNATLVTTGITEVLPVCHDDEAAITALAA